MLRVDERRIKGREIRAPRIVGIFKGAERCVHAESAENDDNRDNLDPPRVAAQSAAKTRLRQKRRGARHQVTSEVAVG
jgi:hypothetical protein